MTQDVELAHDDGDLRFVGRRAAGTATVSLRSSATPEGRFVVRVDKSQADPLLKFALVSQPVLDYAVSIDTPALLDGFDDPPGLHGGQGHRRSLPAVPARPSDHHA